MSGRGDSTDLETAVRMAVYEHFAGTGRPPTVDEVARASGTNAGRVVEAYERLKSRRLLVLEADGRSIRMAPPFSGIETQHAVDARGLEYTANCAWDALGIPAALAGPGTVRSRCEQSGEPLRLEIGLDGPPASSDWLFHSLVPAASWWDDIVFT